MNRRPIVDWRVNFDFQRNNSLPGNDFSHIHSIGGTLQFAGEILRVTRSFDSNNLSGRTVGGMVTDLWLHDFFRTENANMGGMREGQPGFDDNAWFSEHMNRSLLSSPSPIIRFLHPLFR